MADGWKRRSPCPAAATMSSAVVDQPIDAVAVEIGGIGARIGGIAALVGRHREVSRLRQDRHQTAPDSLRRGNRVDAAKTRIARPSPNGDQTTPKNVVCRTGFSITSRSISIELRGGGSFDHPGTRRDSRGLRPTHRSIKKQKGDPFSASPPFFSAPVRIGLHGR